MIERVGLWFCCLNPRERSVLRSTAPSLLLTLFLGVPLDLWEAFWFGLPDAPDKVRDAFRYSYGLDIGTMVIDELDVPAIVIVDGFLGFWVELNVWLLTPEAACLDGCTQPSYGDP